MNTEPIVEIRSLTHRYGSRMALDDLSLDVRRGEIFGFLGPNGSGKTTLFRILCTLLPAPMDAVRILGMELSTHRHAVRREIAVVFQSPSLDKQLTAEENLRCHGHLYGIRGEELNRRIDTLLARVNLSDRRHERVGSFSGGMRRRVELAKGLLNKPRVLLLDEPSTGLDPTARIDLWNTLRDVQQHDGVTVLVTTHLMDEADRCNRLAILVRGKLAACDAPAAMKDRIGGDVITLTGDNPAEIVAQLGARMQIEAEIVDQAVRIEHPRGHELVPRLVEALPGMVQSVSVGKPTLEDVFIQITGHSFRDEEAQAGVAQLSGR
jgi:ABC-2 type transport system ATP-binding protein